MGDAPGDRLRVVVVGGGVAGLTLASALEQAGVDYVLLERRDMVAPQVGASISVYPNAARILHQLGAWEGVTKHFEQLRYFYSRDAKGGLIVDPEPTPLLVEARTGYMMGWGERQNLLRVLYETLKEPGRVLVNKQLVDVQHGADGVTAVCADGSSYRGDILVGADGVYSKTRTKMWELAEPDHADLVQHDRNCMTAEYNCMFGIAKGVDCPQLAPGDLGTAHDVDRCCLTITASGGTVYWFGQERLPRTYRMGETPRYTDEDARAFVARHGDLVIAPGPNGVTLADLWQKTTTFRMVPIEEAKFKLWHWGRIACVGDSIHKATPNQGVGGNAAIESAAALANGIKRLADTWSATGRRPSQGDVERMLAGYKAAREVRAAGVVDASGALIRAHTMHGLSGRLFVRFLRPRLTEVVPELFSNAFIGAVKLDFLPLPAASLTGTQPFNPAQGEGFEESKLRRMLLALPLLAMAAAAAWIMDPAPSLPWADAVLDRGVLDTPAGPVPIQRAFYRLAGLDDFLAVVNTFFFPAMYAIDPASRRQVVSFITDAAVILAIWLLESSRRANLLTPMQLPTLFAALGQLLGIGVLSPVYCLLHYALSPPSSFSALDRRTARPRAAAAVLPAVLLALLLPFYALVFWPDRPARQAWLFVWQLYPLWLAGACWGMSAVWFGGGAGEDAAEDVRRRPLRDLPVLKRCVGVLSLVAAGVWWWTVLGSGLGVAEVFVPRGLPRDTASMTEFAAEFLRWDGVFALGSHLVWLAYLFWDLRGAGMLREGWLTVVGVGLVCVPLVGPGATLGLGWLWREQILATRRHKSALTPESVGKLHGEVF